MKKAEKTLKVAGSGQQKLPETDNQPLNLAKSYRGHEVLSASNAGTELVAAASLSGSSAAPVTVEQSQATLATDNSARLGSLERTHDLVAAHALRLRESGTDHLRVVIQPGEGIHLALELKHSNGRIEAQAFLQQGDFTHLNRHWAELQQQLEPRKIQLGALQNAGQPANGNSGFAQHQKRSSKEETTGSCTSDFVFGGAMTESPVSRTARRKLNRGWETWA
jgi:hypothetical protein